MDVCEFKRPEKRKSKELSIKIHQPDNEEPNKIEKPEKVIEYFPYFSPPDEKFLTTFGYTPKTPVKFSFFAGDMV